MNFLVEKNSLLIKLCKVPLIYSDSRPTRAALLSRSILCSRSRLMSKREEWTSSRSASCGYTKAVFIEVKMLRSFVPSSFLNALGT